MSAELAAMATQTSKKTGATQGCCRKAAPVEVTLGAQEAEGERKNVYECNGQIESMRVDLWSKKGKDRNEHGDLDKPFSFARGSEHLCSPVGALDDEVVRPERTPHAARRTPHAARL